MDDMLGLSQEEYRFVLHAGLKARICRAGTQEHEDICCELGEPIGYRAFYHKASQTIVVPYKNPDSILSATCHEVGHAFAHQRFGQDIGEIYSMLFEVFGTIAGVDLGAISKSEAVRELGILCESITVDFAPIYESLTLAKAAANDPNLLTDPRQFDFVEYTRDLIAKHAPWLSSSAHEGIVAEHLEAVVRGPLSAMHGVIDRSTGKYCEPASPFDPTYHNNYGFSAIAALMVAQRFIPLSVPENPCRATFPEVADVLRDYGGTCLHRLADVKSGAALEALQWCYERVRTPVSSRP
jgi:hypothetical protein